MKSERRFKNYKWKLFPSSMKPNKSGLSITLDDAKRKGLKAVKQSKEWNAEIGRVRDERFGEVNSYREDVLEEVFGIEVVSE